MYENNKNIAYSKTVNEMSWSEGSVQTMEKIEVKLGSIENTGIIAYISIFIFDIMINRSMKY